MLQDLTRLACDQPSLLKDRLVKDKTLKGKNYGTMVKGNWHIYVSPMVYDLLVLPDGTITPEFVAVAQGLKVKILERKVRKR